MRRFLAVSSAYVLGVALMFYFLRFYLDGHFQYVLDDTYIHMSVAENLAFHGVWGITPYEFTSSVSSILWPLILAAGYKVLGPNLYLPLLLNVLSAVLTIAFAHVLLRDGWRFYTFSFLYIFCIGGVAMAFTGMEHLLHLLSLLLLLYVGIFGEGSRFHPLGVLLLSALSTSLRYESVVFVILLAVYYVFRRRVLLAFLTVLGGGLPITVYGLVSAAQGWDFLPASVVLKRHVFNLRNPLGLLDFLGFMAVKRLVGNTDLFSTFLLGLLALLFPLRDHRRLTLLVISLLGFLAQMNFGNIRWFYRYEVYAMGLVLFSALLTLNPARIPQIPNVGRTGLFALFSFVSALLLPLIVRGGLMVKLVPVAAREQFLQDYQMARFVRDYYNGETVVINDVGNVSYFTDARIVDLFGLGTREIFHYWKEGKNTWERIDSLARAKGAKVALIYSDVFYKRYYDINWTEVGGWTISNPQVVGNSTVGVFAVLEDANALREKLCEFFGDFPDGAELYVLSSEDEDPCAQKEGDVGAGK